jgi:predicted HTH transcriptional regulator
MDIIGIEREIIKERKSSESIKTLISNYKGYLRKVISDHITKPLPIQIYNHQSEDHDIVIIYVPPGSYRPYAWFRRNDIFIRKGANNVKPDPDTELPTLKGLRVL